MAWHTVNEVIDTYMIEKIDDDHFHVSFYGYDSEDWSEHHYAIMTFNDDFILTKEMIKDFDFDIQFECLEENTSEIVCYYNEEKFLFHYSDEDVYSLSEFQSLVDQNKCPQGLLLKM